MARYSDQPYANGRGRRVRRWALSTEEIAHSVKEKRWERKSPLAKPERNMEYGKSDGLHRKRSPTPGPIQPSKTGPGMASANNSQKFIGRNPGPRVQIEYDVEVYVAERKVELPSVMGVLADLSGKRVESLPPMADRKFLNIDIDNIDECVKAIRPRAAFGVANTLMGEGQLMVDITFESMGAFLPQRSRATLSRLSNCWMRERSWRTCRCTWTTNLVRRG